MATLSIGGDGAIHLPGSILDRYGLAPDRPFRVIETRTGILIVPLSDGPPDPELARELDEWQALGAEGLEAFPYDEPGE